MPEATGAPGEITCGISICHNQTPNLGPGKIKLSLTEKANSNLKAYDISLQLLYSDREKHGFEILALDHNQNNAGKWIIQDTSYIQLKSGFKHTSRQYLTHTEKGNDTKKWNFQWIPPEQHTQVTFYVSMIAANNNLNNFGDLFYHRTISFTP